MFDLIDLDHLTDPEQVKEGLRLLLNLLEELKQDNVALRKELQRLRDELNRLKGEQAKPDIKANKSREVLQSQSRQELPCFAASGLRGSIWSWREGAFDHFLLCGQYDPTQDSRSYGQYRSVAFLGSTVEMAL